MQDIARETTDLWEDYENGLEYQATSGLAKNLPKFVKFFEGDQWAAPTKNTKNLPRPVVNIIKLICRNKKSAILSTPVKIMYKADRDDASVERFNRFADYIQKEIGQDALDKDAIDDGVKKGSYFFHYYWDAEAKGKDGIEEGGLRCEIIDPLNIFFANPTERDEQKQKWIIIASREDVDSVRAKADRGVDKDAITSDTSDDKYGTVEQDGDKLVTVLTRYFRVGGEVFCEKATKSVVINKPFPITPNVEKARIAIDREDGAAKVDAPNNSLPDKTQGNVRNLIPNEEKAYLYPIVAGVYEKREKSIYGLGEVEGLIPNQKAINFNIAMSLLNAQEVAWGKYVVLPNALGNQTINNEPGQVLVDHSNTGNGIKRLSEQGLPSQPLQLVETLAQLTRVVTGSSEVMTGETIGASMSGAAIAQLQSQALLPVQELKETFWIAKKKQGKVLAQFFKLFYAQKEFTFTDSVTLPGQPTQDVTLRDEFSSAEYAGMDFDVVVETTAGTKSSAAGDIAAIDTLLAKGLISMKTYLKAYPKDALANKEEILKGVEEDEQSQLTQATAMLQQAQATVEQLTAQIKANEDAVNSAATIIAENQRLKQMLAQLYAEASAKIQASNEQVLAGNQMLAETTRDASEMAQYIASRSGQNTAK